MQNVFIWIKLFCIICIFKTGASNSSDELYIENISSSSSSSSSSSIKNRDISYSQHNIKDEVDTISGQQAKRDFLMENKHLINQNDIINNHVNDLTSKDILYKNNDNYLALADDNNNKKSGRVVENESEDVLRFSEIREQQQSNREPPKKSKKRKRKRLRKQKDEETIIKDEDILLRDKSNYNNSSSTNDNTQNDARSENFILNSYQSPDNSNDAGGGTVMEMVGAIVDNNYDVNSQLLNQYEQQQHLLQHDKAPLREEKNNLVMVEREQVPPMKRQMLPSSNEKLSEKKQAKKKLRKGLSKSSSSLSSSNHLKKRKKVMVGDLSCMKSKFIPAPMVSNANIKYIRNEIYGIEKSFLEAEYQCHSGYKLIKKAKKIQSSKGKNLICKNGRWIGRRPMCKEMKMKLKNRRQQCHSAETKKCEQLCVIKDNQTEASCECHKGFRLINNRCIDINECQENEDICEHGCSNTIGGYRCKCPRGFQIDDNNKCVDINECLLRNGHGPCQDVCTNTMGSYKCSCESLEGTWLAKDEHSCEDIDECTVENGGCSHTCLDTMGQAFCVCPEGWILDVDFKTCIDIDECKLQDTMKQEHRCLYDCVNTMGSYKCLDNQADQPLEYELNINNIHNKRDDHDYNDYTSRDEDLMDEIKTDDTDGNFDIIEGASVVSECFNGYYFNETIGDCQDINECEIDNGGCSHKCTNTNGTFYCSCHNGFVLAEDDRYKCIALKILTTEQPKDAEIVNIACPALFPPLHGYLECSRPVENSTMTPTGRLRITNRPGSQCILRCPTSYRAVGKFSKTCGENGNWYGDESGVCMRYPTPKLICHRNMFIEIPSHQDAVELKVPKPKTDVNWIRDITVIPSWAKSEKLSLHEGIINVTFTAKHPISKLKVSCTTTITTLAGEPPSVDFCPDSQKHKIEKHHENIKVEWIEPKFSDNVNVTEVTKTNIPGTYFGLGSHQIIYEAKDAAGYKNRCIFKIVVNAPKRKGLQLPINNNNKFNY